jgi:DNA-binding beta-propeller fold protein YncE
MGGIIDLFPIRNSHWIEIPFEDDSLVRWVKDQTDPKAVFLTARYVNHGILLAGRRIFYGHPYYPQSAGYSLDERERVYKRMFAERNPQELLRILKENNISYVAIDNGLKNDDFVKNVNESVYKSTFEQVFQDTENRQNGLVIYKVPENLSDVPASLLQEFKVNSIDTSIPAIGVFEGGYGKGRGQFDTPRGVAVDASANIYVADLGNARVQKFSPEGNFLVSFGIPGTGDGEFRAPNGITIDSTGNIYVTDAYNHRLYKFKADGTFEKQWNGPTPGFYGPRDVAIGPQKQLYVIDQGRNRVVRLDPEGENFAEWGQKGTNESEFSDPTGLDVAGDRVYVADAGNSRVQVFDLDGKFIRQWAVPEWGKSLGHFPDVAFDAQTNRLYATSALTNDVLVFDSDGNTLESLKPAALDNPSSLVLADTVNGKRLFILNTNGGHVTQIKLSETTRRK